MQGAHVLCGHAVSLLPMRHHDSKPCLTPLWRAQGLGCAADPDDAPVARAAAALPLAAGAGAEAGAGRGTEPGARADEEGSLLLPRAPPERRGTRVSARAGAGPLTLRLSELGLAELPRLTALAGAQLAPAPPAAPRAAASTEAAAAEPAALAGAPFVVENLCPVALEFGQEGTDEAVALAPGARAAYRWRAHPALLPRAARLLRLRGCAGQRAAARRARGRASCSSAARAGGGAGRAGGRSRTCGLERRLRRSHAGCVQRGRRMAGRPVGARRCDCCQGRSAVARDAAAGRAGHQCDGRPGDAPPLRAAGRTRLCPTGARA